MSHVSKLLSDYQEFIALPWAQDAAAAQRVIFGIYDPADELKFRAIIDDFELATKAAKHAWKSIDIEKSFADWIAEMKYKEKYFQKPELLLSVMDRYSEFLAEKIKHVCCDYMQDSNAVIAIYGTGAIFGFAKVKRMIDMLSPVISGRLLVFFPGSYENNNYRLLNGYDGWNYLAINLNK